MAKVKGKHRVRRFFKWFFIVIIGLVVLLYATVFIGHKFLFKLHSTNHPTIETVSSSNYRFGAAARTQPKTMLGYVKVVSSQVKNYNEHLNNYWPNNPQKNQYLIAQDVKTKTAYLVNPSGEYKKLTSKQFDSYNVPSTMQVTGEWNPFSGNGIEGAYITVSPQALSNYYVYQRYEHLGTYDQFLSYSHELFHTITQKNWGDNKYGNLNRDERLSDSTGRRSRMLLMQQLSLAITDTANRDTHIKDALATYNQYEKQDKKDYDASILYDRLEGTAFYYELKSALYAAYPNQVKNESEVYPAITALLKNDNPAYRATGAVTEAYKVGGYAGILLDLKAMENNQDPNDWKNEVAKDGDATPLTLLAKEYEGQTLPSPQTIPTKQAYKKWIGAYNKIDPINSQPAIIFNVLYAWLYGGE